jgi:hypothetical protein
MAAEKARMSLQITGRTYLLIKRYSIDYLNGSHGGGMAPLVSLNPET